MLMLWIFMVEIWFIYSTLYKLWETLKVEGYREIRQIYGDMCENIMVDSRIESVKSVVIREAFSWKLFSQGRSEWMRIVLIAVITGNTATNLTWLSFTWHLYQLFWIAVKQQSIHKGILKLHDLWPETITPTQPPNAVYFQRDDDQSQTYSYFSCRRFQKGFSVYFQSALLDPLMVL